MTLLDLARGPLFKLALAVFFLGLMVRLVRVLAMGQKKDLAPPAGSAAVGAVKAYVSGLIPWSSIFKRRPVTYIGGYLFHIGILGVIFFVSAHTQLWKSVIGFSWPGVGTGTADLLTMAAFIGLALLLVNRLTLPVMRLLSDPDDWLALLFSFLPLVTGYMATHSLLVKYETMLGLHFLAAEVLLVYIPFSRLSHMVLFFITRPLHGMIFGKIGSRV